jgi:hypothetical protein
MNVALTSLDKFPIGLDETWEALGYTQKGSAVRTLTNKEYIESMPNARLQICKTSNTHLQICKTPNTHLQICKTPNIYKKNILQMWITWKVPPVVQTPNELST